MVNKRNLLVRTATGVVYVAVILCAIHFGATAFAALCTLVSVFAMREYARLINQRGDGHISTSLSMLGGLLSGLLCYAIPNTNLQPLFLCAYLLFLLVMSARGVFHFGKQTVTESAYFMLGQMAVALPFGFLILLASHGGSFSKEMMFLFFGLIWLNDSAAYLIGSAFGKHRMAEKISPKKSWEGFAGGLTVSMGACVGCYFLLREQIPFFDSHAWWFWAALACVIILSGTVGDFLESLFKRSVGVKDSGRLLPGHGGLLDRFDSTMMAAPTLYLFLEIIHFFS